MSSLAITYSRANSGIEAPLVTVETHISKGLPAFNIVGLPETVVKESRERVRAAIQNTHFKFPVRRITINLAPADLPKEGGRFDLPIAIGILIASEQLPSHDIHQFELAGELAFSGELRPVRGILAFTMATQKANRALIIPEHNAPEAGLIRNITIYPAKHLLDVCAHFLTTKTLMPYIVTREESPIIRLQELGDIHGQLMPKRALEIAAAGHHHLLMLGPPGTGKTLLSRCLPGILPKLSEEEALEIASIYSLSEKSFHPHLWNIRPFRAPHHTISNIALVGGGNPPKPGEISLAHRGVLFLDELPEFQRNALEALREPLEHHHISISRARHQMQFPAQFQLIAAMNPCPCGNYGYFPNKCYCRTERIHSYQQRISGPLLDRFDLHIEVPPLPKGTLSTPDSHTLSSNDLQQRVIEAQQKQLLRTKKLNGLLTNREIKAISQLNTQQEHFLEDMIEQFQLSARTYYKLLRLARTIADLDNSDKIQREHLQQSLSFRCLEKLKFHP